MTRNRSAAPPAAEYTFASPTIVTVRSDGEERLIYLDADGQLWEGTRDSRISNAPVNLTPPREYLWRRLKGPHDE